MARDIFHAGGTPPRISGLTHAPPTRGPELIGAGESEPASRGRIRVHRAGGCGDSSRRRIAGQ